MVISYGSIFAIFIYLKGCQLAAAKVLALTDAIHL
jgi:hypothetical protein